MKYVLKKDTPENKEGAILYKAEEEYFIKDWNGFYPAEIVENNPDWFKEVEDSIETIIHKANPKSKDKYVQVIIRLGEGYTGKWNVKKIAEDIEKHCNDTFNNS